MGHLVLLLTSTVGCFVVAFELSGRYSGGRRELGRSIDFCTSGVCLEVESLGARRTILQHNDCRMPIELCQSLSKPLRRDKRLCNRIGVWVVEYTPVIVKIWQDGGSIIREGVTC